MNYIKYDSPEWKKISQCLVRLGIYGNRECKKAAYVYDCGPEPAIEAMDNNGHVSWPQSRALANEAVALLNEKHPEYKWKRTQTSVIKGVKR